MRIHFAWIAAIAFMAFGAGIGSSQAAPVAVTNSSFEDAVLADGAFAGGTPAGWTLESGSGVGVINPSLATFPGGADDGVNVMYSTSLSEVSQATGEIIDIGDTFTLTVALGNRADTPARDMQIQLRAADGSVLATSAVFGDGDIADGTFVDVTATFTADAMTAGLGGAVEIFLNTVGGSGQAVFDNVRLDVTAGGGPMPVPEPATMSLLGAGLIGAFALRRRRKQI